jgi:hypothetical protein
VAIPGDVEPVGRAILGISEVGALKEDCKSVCQVDFNESSANAGAGRTMDRDATPHAAINASDGLTGNERSVDGCVRRRFSEKDSV